MRSAAGDTGHPTEGHGHRPIRSPRRSGSRSRAPTNSTCSRRVRSPKKPSAATGAAQRNPGTVEMPNGRSARSCRPRRRSRPRHPTSRTLPDRSAAPAAMSRMPMPMTATDHQREPVLVRQHTNRRDHRIAEATGDRAGDRSARPAARADPVPGASTRCSTTQVDEQHPGEGDTAARRARASASDRGALLGDDERGDAERGERGQHVVAHDRREARDQAAEQRPRPPPSSTNATASRASASAGACSQKSAP